MCKIIIFAEQDDREYQCHSVLFTYLLLNEYMTIIVNKTTKKCQRSVKKGRTVYLKSTGKTFNRSILDIVCLRSVFSLRVGGLWHLYFLISSFYMADYLNRLSLADFKKCLGLRAFIKVSGG